MAGSRQKGLVGGHSREGQVYRGGPDWSLLHLRYNEQSYFLGKDQFHSIL